MSKLVDLGSVSKSTQMNSFHGVLVDGPPAACSCHPGQMHAQTSDFGCGGFMDEDEKDLDWDRLDE